MTAGDSRIRDSAPTSGARLPSRPAGPAHVRANGPRLGIPSAPPVEMVLRRREALFRVGHRLRPESCRHRIEFAKILNQVSVAPSGRSGGLLVQPFAAPNGSREDHVPINCASAWSRESPGETVPPTLRRHWGPYWTNAHDAEECGVLRPLGEGSAPVPPPVRERSSPTARR